MAPGQGRRSESIEPQAFHALGKAGRKTGVVLQNTGRLDAQGFQPLDELDSDEDAPVGNGRRASTEDEDSGSDDMDIESNAGDGPQTVLKKHFQRMSLPRSRSPKKTNLGSPARRNPHFSSSRDDVADDPTVTRKLNFGKPQSQPRPKPNGINGSSSHVEDYHVEEEDDEEEDDEEEEEVEEEEEEEVEGDTQDTVIRRNDLEEDNTDLLEESLQMVEAMGGDTPSPEPEAPPAAQPEEEDDKEDEPIVRQAPAKKKGRGRPKAAPKPIAEDPPEEPTAAEETPRGNEDAQLSVPKRRGRPAKKDAKRKEPEPVKSKKRPSAELSIEEHSMGSEEEDDAEPEPQPQPKRQKTANPKSSQATVAKPAPAKPAREAPAVAKAAAPKPAPKPRGRPGRKPKGQATEGSTEVGETSFAALQRGPPLPKSRGLVSARRDPDAVTMTRSGRQSHRPLDYWKGEQVSWEYETREDQFAHNRFAVPTNKGVTCPPQPPSPQAKRAPRYKAKGKSTRVSQKPEVEYEDWEVGAGKVSGEVVLWEPEHEHLPPAEDEPVEVIEETLAVSAEAIQTKDARDATFRFAKTLTTPFMGAGVVDLPPGAEKRPKNSRRMHMVFFVQFGKVLVSVNETQFRITAGGMWFVPRGNYYTINNDYDAPCRIFFSQACEISAQPVDPDMSQNSTMALGS
ncbi:Mif2/CENP-C like-domain-containing protein [Thelonectria olida]|uniref:CENP-C homolog n=1 Tax=Thelonectria olida TaxID=1576542 RepID=A0A9P8WHN5_9HYPO|nr:Mif2/CENP-C like-domain-containing protein [Thelonectria olida]